MPVLVLGYEEVDDFLLLPMFVYHFMQAMYAQSSVSVGMKGASKAMAAMNKVAWFVLYF